MFYARRKREKGYMKSAQQQQQNYKKFKQSFQIFVHHTKVNEKREWNEGERQRAMGQKVEEKYVLFFFFFIGIYLYLSFTETEEEDIIFHE